MATTIADDTNVKNENSLTESQRWTKIYGLLILFFEEHGHTNVPPTLETKMLYDWVTEQRSKYALLSAQQTKQLRILNFQSKGKASSIKKGVVRCSFSSDDEQSCNRFAAFNGYCHEHFAAIQQQQQSQPTKTKATKKKKSDDCDADPTGKIKVEHPLVGFKKRKNGNYDIESSKEKLKDISREYVINRINLFIQKQSNWKNCPNTYNKSKVSTTCTCMTYLRDKPHFLIESISNALLEYYELSPIMRKRYAVERMRYAELGKRKNYQPKEGPQRVYMLPLSYEYLEGKTSEEEEEEENDDGEGDEEHISSKKNGKRQEMIAEAFKHRICVNAFRNIHNIGSTQCRTLFQYQNGDLSAIQHGNSGKEWHSTKKYAEVYQSLRDSLTILFEEYQQDANRKGEIMLPSQFSKRKWFENWTRSRGWDPKKLNPTLTLYHRVEDWDLMPGFYRSEEEAIAHGGDARNVAKTPVSWTVFARFWNAEFPQLKTRGRVGKGMFGGKYDFDKKKYYVGDG
eukprot:CAMPEP_0183732328 /NCGR_PEP_ID=MMETSP0737-20130205/38182_1 /TAXON_ID=385413 /ORGANISM="Thalassiosira miniscula, Strain CCMP1093" /LENGTH=511 /DNA_ID=CAMNT_0025965313 /DNA_START=88 /DNA_END=1623 /DNA_ORIENTATION=+